MSGPDDRSEWGDRRLDDPDWWFQGEARRCVAGVVGAFRSEVTVAVIGAPLDRSGLVFSQS
jgi:hypothetical protein